MFRYEMTFRYIMLIACVQRDTDQNLPPPATGRGRLQKVCLSPARWSQVTQEHCNIKKKSNKKNNNKKKLFNTHLRSKPNLFSYNSNYTNDYELLTCVGTWVWEG